VTLTAAFRQKNDSGFFSLLQRLRVGRLRSEDVEALNGCVDRRFPADSIEPTILHSHCAAVGGINEGRLKELEEAGGDARSFEAKDEGLVDLLRACPAKKIVRLCAGAQVILTKNLPGGLANGSRGVVEEWAGEIPRVKFSVNGAEVFFNVGRVDFEATLAGKVVAKRSQIPLALG